MSVDPSNSWAVAPTWRWWLCRSTISSYMTNVLVYTIFTHKIHACELRIELPFYVILEIINATSVGAWKISIVPHNNELSVGLIAQLVKPCTVFRKFKVALNPTYRIFFKLCQRLRLIMLHQGLVSFLISWLKHQVIKSGCNDPSKYKCLKLY